MPKKQKDQSISGAVSSTTAKSSNRSISKKVTIQSKGGHGENDSRNPVKPVNHKSMVSAEQQLVSTQQKSQTNQPSHPPKPTRSISRHVMISSNKQKLNLNPVPQMEKDLAFQTYPDGVKNQHSVEVTQSEVIPTANIDPKQILKNPNPVNSLIVENKHVHGDGVKIEVVSEKGTKNVTPNDNLSLARPDLHFNAPSEFQELQYHFRGSIDKAAQSAHRMMDALQKQNNDVLVANLNISSDMELRGDYHDFITFKSDTTVPTLFALVSDNQSLEVEANLTDYTSGITASNFKLFNQTASLLSTGTGVICVQFQPSGWEIPIPSPLDVQRTNLISTITFQGSRNTTVHIIDRFLASLKTSIALFRLRNTVATSVHFSRFNATLGKIADDKTIDPNDVFLPPVEGRPLEISDVSLIGCPALAIFLPVNEIWARFAFNEFTRNNVVIRLGKSQIVSFLGTNVYATSSTFIDTYSSYILNNSFNHVQASRLTQASLNAMLNALKFESTVVSITTQLDANPRFLRYGPTPDDTSNLAFCMFIDYDLRDLLIAKAKDLLESFNFFKETTARNIFTDAALYPVTAGKSSKFLPEVASFYNDGSLDKFLNMMILEHYSSFYSFDLITRVEDNTYLSVFTIMDILLFFLFCPKIAWSNSAKLGANLVALFNLLFPAEIAQFHDVHGLVSQLQQGVWVRSNLNNISQQDVLGDEDSGPKQYSILVHVGGTNDPRVNTMFNIPNLIQFRSTRIQVTRKNIARFPYTSNSNMYTTSWVGHDYNVRAANYVDDADLSNRFKLVITYANTLILRWQKTTNLTNIDADNATIAHLFQGLSNAAVESGNMMSTLMWTASKILANSYYIWHEWFHEDTNYLRAQPDVGLSIIRNGRNTMIPLNKPIVKINVALATYSLMNVVAINATPDFKRNVRNAVLQTTETVITIAPMPTIPLVNEYLNLINTYKLEVEKFNYVAAWYGEATFAPYVRPFNAVLSNSVYNIIGDFIAREIESNLFQKMVTSLLKLGSDNVMHYDIRGTWELCLTRLNGDFSYNNTMHNNRMFGFHLTGVSQHVLNIFNLANFLSFSTNSPIFNRVQGVRLRRERVYTLDPFGALDNVVYRAEIILPNEFLITRLDLVNHPIVQGVQVTKVRYHLSADVYENVQDIIASGRVYHFICPDQTYFKQIDFDIIHQLVVAGVIHITMTGITLQYTLTSTSSAYQFYQDEMEMSKSWIRNVLLTSSADTVFEYNFFMLYKPPMIDSVSPLSIYTFVHLPAGTQNPAIIQSIVDDPAYLNFAPRTVDTQIWRATADYDRAPNGMLLFQDKVLKLAGSFPYYYPNFFTDLPEITVSDVGEHV